jgi:membrane dipeptidase
MSKQTKENSNNMKQYFLSLITIILVNINLYSQSISISGVVRDKLSMQPIDSARIDIISKTNPAEHYWTNTNALGFWSYTFQPSMVDDQSLLLNNYKVEQNYPNPFNPSTHINFTTPIPGNVIVTVHNSIGELVDKKSYSLEAGSYSIEWTSKGAAGVLFYTLDFGEKQITKKMIQLDGGTGNGLGAYLKYGGVSSFSCINKISLNEYYIIASKFVYMPDTITISSGNNQINFLLETIHNKVFVIDLHNDVLEKVINGYQLGIRHTTEHSDLPRFKEGGVDAQMFAVWVSPGDSLIHPFYSYSIEMIDSFYSQVSMNSSQFAQARNYNEIVEANTNGKLAGILAIEGGHAIENNLDKLKQLYNRGVRYLTITWNNSTAWAVSGQDSRSLTVGLSEFGKQVIRTLDSLGVIIDVAHTGIKTINDILTVTKNPIINSHCGVRKLRNHYRNLYDYQIDSIAAHGGVIGVMFYPPFLSSQSYVNIDTVVKHIDYIKQRVGIDYIALGSDFDGIEQTVVGLEDVSKLPKLTAALLKKNYSISDIRKILGENYLRVFKKICN